MSERWAFSFEGAPCSAERVGFRFLDVGKQPGVAEYGEIRLRARATIDSTKLLVLNNSKERATNPP